MDLHIFLLFVALIKVCFITISSNPCLIWYCLCGSLRLIPFIHRKIFTLLANSSIEPSSYSATYQHLHSPGHRHKAMTPHPHPPYVKSFIVPHTQHLTSYLIEASVFTSHVWNVYVSLLLRPCIQDKDWQLQDASPFLCDRKKRMVWAVRLGRELKKWA